MIHDMLGRHLAAYIDRIIENSKIFEKLVEYFTIL